MDTVSTSVLLRFIVESWNGIVIIIAVFKGRNSHGTYLRDVCQVSLRNYPRNSCTTELSKDHSIEPRPKDLQKYLSSLYISMWLCNFLVWAWPGWPSLIWVVPALPFHAPLVRPKPCLTWSNFHQICFGQVSSRPLLKVKLHLNLSKDVSGQVYVPRNNCFCFCSRSVAAFTHGQMTLQLPPMYTQIALLPKYTFIIFCLLRELWSWALHELCVFRELQ